MKPGDKTLLQKLADESGPWRVLLAEDDALLADTVNDFLTDEGFTVSPAVDGAAAVDLAQTIEYDVLLTDLRMPNLDGLALIKRLRDTRPDLPVVIMSGNAPADLRVSLNGCGDGPLIMISKPMRLTQLLGALNEVLRQRFTI